MPPSKKELKSRLEKRGRDNKREIKKRLSLAVSEMKHYHEYKYVVINDKIINTVNIIKKIIDFEILNNELNEKIFKYKID